MVDMPIASPEGSALNLESRAASQCRRAGSQQYLLDKYEELGTLHLAFGALVQLHDRDPDAYREITGSARLLQYETYHRYWSEIPLAQRRAARRRYLSPN